MTVAVILLALAVAMLTDIVRRLERRVAYLEEQEFEGRITEMFDFLTDGLDPEDED